MWPKKQGINIFFLFNSFYRHSSEGQGKTAVNVVDLLLSESIAGPL